MHQIPSKEEMINAVKKSGCPRLNCIPFQYMTQEQLYTRLLEAKCPCLEKLMRERKSQSSSASINHIPSSK
jgi:hypothetical protein